MGEVRPEPNFVVWLDPGMTTGIATYDFYWHEFKSMQYLFQESGSWLDNTLSWSKIDHGRQIAIGWEQYLNVGGARSGTASYSYEMIGVARYLAVKHGAHLLQAQPSSARKLGSDDKLQKLGWYTPGKRHANDAANHCLAFLLRERKLPAQLQGRLFTDLPSGDRMISTAGQEETLGSDEEGTF